jgi:pyrrolysine biosynthesis protein PylC
MVRLLGDLYATPKNDFPPAGDISRGTVYEHIFVSGDKLMISGERIMTEGGPLNLQSDFFGADEAITNFVPGNDQWVATLIFSGTNRQRAWEKRDSSIANITRHLGIKEVVDPIPEVIAGNIRTHTLK